MIESRRGAELRVAPGRRIYGAAMRYGNRARVRMPDGTPVVESFAAFAFDQYLRSGAETRLNLQHDPRIEVASTAGETRARGRLVLRDNPDAVTLETRLPSGSVFDQVLDMIAAGELAETSVEFRALDEAVNGERRIIRSATLPAVGIVDQGAYGAGGKIEVRREGRGIAGRVYYNRPRVTADRGRRRKQAFAPAAFGYAIRDTEREILAQLGDDAGQVLGSRKAGTLLINDTPEALEFEVPELPETTYGRDFGELLDAGTIVPGVLPLFRIPPAETVPNALSYEADPEAPDVEIETVHAALLTALSIRYRPPRGNPGEVERRTAPRPRRRALVWL